jgi:hypothetical protein
MSPPVSNSDYGTERDMQYTNHEETAENHDSANEAANNNDSDDGTQAATIHYSIPPPPAGLLYDTLEDALESIPGFTKEHGYALTKLRSKKGKDGEVNKVYWYPLYP